ncbi:MAG: YggS family pyridoxal phosphate-dependent enzyme [Candidatus Poribacteria bacterium]|nr:YggS family pyridoxal phosphate-dependent enzyme [Candidatus Poribacteria bacterium]
MNWIAENLASVKERMAAAAERSGRSPDSIKLVPVTKGRSISEIQSLLAAGATDIGENRIQEAQQKYDPIHSFLAASNTLKCDWHLIGHLQRNKVKSALEIFSLIHSVDSLRLLAEISRRTEVLKKQTDILIQINTTGEESKFGLDSEDVFDFMEKSLSYSSVRIVGLMTMGVLSPSPETNRPAFALLRTLSDRIKTEKYPGITMQYLSMGMTDDFEVAIEEGANLVRIGRAIFETTV